MGSLGMFWTACPVRLLDAGAGWMLQAWVKRYRYENRSIFFAGFLLLLLLFALLWRPLVAIGVERDFGRDGVRV